ncbi:MAG: DUF3634 family protein [Myxococcales bacterium]|nr:DUF3634 family protein [Myxococcales bacterium]MCB9713976.1 DUF3634 family protein [Myxococcales bacterium]
MGGAVVVAVVAGLAGLALVVARGGLDGARFTVEVRGEGPGGVMVKGTVPGFSAAEIAEFVAELELPAGARIRGIPEGDRVVLRFSEQVPEHLHQRIRNVFYLHR